MTLIDRLAVYAPYLPALTLGAIALTLGFVTGEHAALGTWDHEQTLICLLVSFCANYVSFRLIANRAGWV